MAPSSPRQGDSCPSAEARSAVSTSPSGLFHSQKLAQTESPPANVLRASPSPRGKPEPLTMACKAQGVWTQIISDYTCLTPRASSHSSTLQLIPVPCAWTVPLSCSTHSHSPLLHIIQYSAKGTTSKGLSRSHNLKDPPHHIPSTAEFTLHICCWYTISVSSLMWVPGEKNVSHQSISSS